jgi:hypothetical protein
VHINAVRKFDFVKKKKRYVISHCVILYFSTPKYEELNFSKRFFCPRPLLFIIIHFYVLTLQLNPIFLLSLCSVSIVYSSFQCLCATVRSSFISRKTHSKIFEQFLAVILQTSKYIVEFSFPLSCSEHVMNPVF